MGLNFKFPKIAESKQTEYDSGSYIFDQFNSNSNRLPGDFLFDSNFRPLQLTFV